MTVKLITVSRTQVIDAFDTEYVCDWCGAEETTQDAFCLPLTWFQVSFPGGGVRDAVRGHLCSALCFQAHVTRFFDMGGVAGAYLAPEMSVRAHSERVS